MEAMGKYGICKSLHDLDWFYVKIMVSFVVSVRTAELRLCANLSFREPNAQLLFDGNDLAYSK